MADLTEDWREFLSLLTSHRVKFLVVGGHACPCAGDRVSRADVRVEMARDLGAKFRGADVRCEMPDYGLVDSSFDD